MRLRVLVTVLALSLSACSTVPVSRDAASVSAHNNLNATLWMQTAAEYEAATLAAFHNATEKMQAAANDPSWSALPADERSPDADLPLAVIVDADETMVDNSPFQARNIRDDSRYSSEAWLAWVNERAARAVPGAQAFADAAAKMGVTVFFVTNRAYPEEFAGTADNLRKLGYPIAADNSNLFLAGDPRAPEHEKGTRRRWIGERYRVVLLIGDNLGDFVDGYRSSIEQRGALVQQHADWWGRRWIMLPNPAYGSWEAAIRLRCGETEAGNECLLRGLRYE
ncbi:5'-nucleotidase, lipoprotein e(P4) family [Pseudomarimonas arenosa]|uniref:Acid phosphatase n=1 Tax=Pseudomarimonas arenosa TaxID=2774145 RepID=A0AAW3ZPV2_9GAMM|nr:HAD family acid phosphatase [Pseudomarimonas arenosa]MBD8526642.1 acid phosphatase [Pseudomarimonas arenosa]